MAICASGEKAIARSDRYTPWVGGHSWSLKNYNCNMFTANDHINVDCKCKASIKRQSHRGQVPDRQANWTVACQTTGTASSSNINSHH